MSEKVPAVPVELSPEERALLLNDLSKLTVEQRGDLYVKVCKSLGLNPLTQPFAYITLNGKLTLYAQRNCTDQLRSLQNVSLEIVSREKQGDLYVVTARATLASGRKDESVGAVTLTNLKGDALANAIMKCETKAKRRVTLSICGLSFMDETEVETIKDVSPPEISQAKPKPMNYAPGYREPKNKAPDDTLPAGNANRISESKKQPQTLSVSNHAPASNELLNDINSMAIERGIAEKDLNALIAAYGQRTNFTPTWIAREVADLLSNEDCNTETVRAYTQRVVSRREAKRIREQAGAQ